MHKSPHDQYSKRMDTNKELIVTETALLFGSLLMKLQGKIFHQHYTTCHRVIVDLMRQLMLPTFTMIYEKERCPICQPKGYPTPVKLLTTVIDKRLMWFHKHMGLFTVLELDFSHVTLKAVNSNPGPHVESGQVRSLITRTIASF